MENNFAVFSQSRVYKTRMVVQGQFVEPVVRLNDLYVKSFYKIKSDI